MSKNQNTLNLNIIIHQRNIIIHSTSKCSQMLNYFRTSSPSTHPSTLPNPLPPRAPHLQLGCDGVDGGEGEGPGAGGAEGGKPT